MNLCYFPLLFENETLNELVLIINPKTLKTRFFKQGFKNGLRYLFEDIWEQNLTQSFLS